jgi:2-oxoisovalerate dehydrogenase E1 component
VAEAAERCRTGTGPRLVEARTQRWHGHFEGDQQKYRSGDELAAIREQDPVAGLGARLQAEGWADAAWIDQVVVEAAAEIQAAVEFGAAGEPLSSAELLALVGAGTG